jgi:hypothetical protein
VGCGESRNEGNPETLRDTSGTVFGWNCTAEKGCELGAVNPPVATCGTGQVFYGYFRSRFVSICAATGIGSGAWANAPFCRLVACGGDSECPAWADETFSCVNGLCQFNTSAPVDAEDAIALCLGGMPRPNGCQAEAVDPALAMLEADVGAECTNAGHCTLPQCRQP